MDLPTTPTDQADNTAPVPGITKAPATLLIGPSGTGKTTSLTTYLAAGLELFVIVTDPGGEEALIDTCLRNKLPIDKLHWHYIPASSISWDSVLKAGKAVNTMSYESLGGLKHGLEKNQHKQYLAVIEALADFPCDRTGKKYGPVDKFGADKALAIDSFTGINKMIKRLVVGAKPTLHQGEWGVSMEVEEQFLDLIIGNVRCFFCAIAHIETTMDKTRGKPMLMASFLGSKLSPKIPAMFSDVVLTQKEGAKFSWSTIAHNVDLKARTLPLSNTIPPDFQLVVKGWKQREEAIRAAGITAPT